MKFGNKTIVLLFTIFFFVFVLLNYCFTNYYYENFENNDKIKIVINSYKDNSIALNKLLVSLQKCKEYTNFEIIVFIGGYYNNDKYILEKQNNITYIYCNHNSIDFTGLLGILEFLPKQNEYYFYLHDTCVVGSNFLKNISLINLKDVTSLSLKTLPSMNIGIYSNDIIHQFSNTLLTYKNTDHSKLQEFKTKGQHNEDLIFKMDNNNKLIDNKDHFLSVSEPYDYYGTGVLRVVEYYDLDLYKIKANWDVKNIYELKV